MGLHGLDMGHDFEDNYYIDYIFDGNNNDSEEQGVRDDRSD